METFFSIVAVLSLVCCVAIVIDKTIFERRIKEIKTGMTGRDVEKVSGCHLRIVKIEKNVYYAKVQSLCSLFKYRLVFLNGKLISKQKEN